MEQLYYLIRTLTYKRSVYEIKLKEIRFNQFSQRKANLEGLINGLSIAIIEIYKLIQETDEN